MLRMPFLNPDESVTECLVNNSMKSEPGDERMTRFEDYLEDVYKSEEAQYPLEIDFRYHLFKLNKTRAYFICMIFVHLYLGGSLQSPILPIYTIKKLQIFCDAYKSIPFHRPNFLLLYLTVCWKV